MITRPSQARASRAAILLPALLAGTAVMCACSRSGETPVEIRFGVAGSSRAATPERVQFYVHDIELLDANGGAHAVRLAEAPPWQSARLALVELASNAGTNRHASVRGMVDTGSSGTNGFAGVRFTLGVPFELNHANPLTAAPPLNRGELLWSWQTGYKFLRADLAIDGREWSFHLGSTGCASASALRPPAAPCARPNRMRVALEGEPLAGVIQLDLDALAAAARAASYVVCTGNYQHDPACAAPYAMTALDAASGACPDTRCAQQRLWRLGRPQ